MPRWIEGELSRQLKPVAAPPTLWNRVSSAGARKRKDLRWIFWPAVAGLVLAASSEVRYHVQQPTVTPGWVRAVSAKSANEACVQCHSVKL